MADTGVHAVILAAGGSGRFGQPKQLLELDGEILIHRAVRQALASGADGVSVVLGANRALIEPQLQDQAVDIVIAEHWRDGLAASLRAGIEHLPSSCGGALVTLADQIQIEASDLNKLLRTWQAQPEAIVASTYDGVTGVPAVFPARVFPELESLTGDTGGKGLIARDPNVVAVPLPNAAFDLNTPADLARFKSATRP